MSSKARRNQRQAAAAAKPTEVMGIDHPSMTREKAKELLSSGVTIPIELLFRIGPLCNPMEYRGIPNGALMEIADQLNGLLDKALREAQEPAPNAT